MKVNNDHIRKRGKYYYFESTIDGIRLPQCSLKTKNKDLAKEKALKLFEEYAQKPKEIIINEKRRITIRELFESFINYRYEHEDDSERTISTYKYLINHIYDEFSEKMIVENMTIDMELNG